VRDEIEAICEIYPLPEHPTQPPKQEVSASLDRVAHIEVELSQLKAKLYHLRLIVGRSLQAEDCFRI
jgi:vacuolar-type H+-ATPase subunit I/STV1